MTRPYPPPLMVSPTFEPFIIEPQDQWRLACSLGLTHLGDELAGAIAHAISCYLATRDGSGDTTVGATLAALAQLARSGRTFDDAVARFADDRYGIDYFTHALLQPLARAVLSNEANARAALSTAACERAAQLRAHPRVAPETEALRFFCGVLRTIFNAAAAPTIERTWRNCRRFALEVLSIAAVDHADFDAHPERLDEYLGTEVDPA